MNITLLGVASAPILHTENSQGRVLLPTKGCYHLHYRDVRLLVGHDFGHVYAHTSDGSLDCWIDHDIGVLFSATVPLDDDGARIARLAHGSCGASVGHLCPDTTVGEDGIERVIYTTIEEISLLATAGACPAAFCWDLDEDITTLPRHLQFLAYRTKASMQRRQLSAWQTAPRPSRSAEARRWASPQESLPPPLPDLAEMRAAYLANFQHSGHRSMIVGHMMFSKKAGPLQ